MPSGEGWEPAAELNTIQNEMNRLFNTYFDQPAATGRASAASRRWVPAMDLVETADQYILRADLPGLSDDDINIQLEDNVLTISGERKTQHEMHEEGYYRVERASCSFARSLTLPQAALLAGLTKAPSAYDPLDSPTSALARRNEVLAAMRDEGMINARQYRFAVRSLLTRPGTPVRS